MRKTPAIVWNVTGQVLELRFPLGRPTSATFKVFRAHADDDSVPLFSGDASVDSVNAATTATAGQSQYDPQRIDLDSTAGIVAARKYLLEANGVVETVQPVEIAATHIRARHVLKNDFAPGAAFVGTTLSAAVDPVWITERSSLSDLSDTMPDYRVRWEVVHAGKTQVLYSFFDVLRAIASHGVGIEDVTDRQPGLRDSLPPEFRVEEGRPLIDAAWRSVQAHLVAVGIDPSALRDNQAVDELVILRALRLVAEGGWRPPGTDWATYVELSATRYDRFFEQHYGVSLKHRVDYQVGSPGPDEPLNKPQKFWRK